MQALSYGEVTTLTTNKLVQLAQFAIVFVLINKLLKKYADVFERL